MTLANILIPSDKYLKTIALGLKEAYNFSAKESANYLIEKLDIKGNLTVNGLLSLL